MARMDYEAAIVFPIAEHLHKYLNQRGVRAFMPRPDDDEHSGAYDIGADFDQRRRVVKDVANTLGRVDLFLSLHGNSAGPTANGTECWYLHAEDAELATRLAGAVARRCGRRNRGGKQSTPETVVKPGYYFFTTIAPHELCLEVAFVTNGDDCEDMKERPDLYAAAIGDVLLDHYGEGAVVCVDAGHGSTATGYDVGALAYNHPAVIERLGNEAIAASATGDVGEPHEGTPEREPWLTEQLRQAREEIAGVRIGRAYTEESKNGMEHWLRIAWAELVHLNDQQLDLAGIGISSELLSRADGPDEFIERNVMEGSRSNMAKRYGDDWERKSR